VANANRKNNIILDETTSVLDATSRILVFEALKRWCQHKTTVVIIHGLSQIEPQDFVYVLKHGQVAEQEYRYDLEGVTGAQHDADSGEFRKMMEVQRATGGFLPEENVDANIIINKNAELEEAFEGPDEEDEAHDTIPTYLKHQSIAIRPLTFGKLDVRGRCGFYWRQTVYHRPSSLSHQRIDVPRQPVRACG
jgi:ATP-binding cassette subfamily B (MDR/TAP) protein 1